MSLPSLPTAAVPADSPYKLVSTVEQLDSLLAELEAASLISIDTETMGLSYDDLIVGVCLATEVGTGYYIPIRHEEFPGTLYAGQLPARYVFDRLREVLQNTWCVAHNLKFDDKMLQKENIFCKWRADTLAMAKLFGKWKENGLKFLVKELLHHDMDDLASLFPKIGNRKVQIAPQILSPHEIFHYAVEDANWTLQLYNYLLDKLCPGVHDDSNLFKVEMALLPVVGEMEAFGLPVNKEFLQTQGERAREIITRLEEDIMQQIRQRLNDPDYVVSLTSPPQLAKLLFEDLELPVLATSETTGKPSAAKEVLQELAEMDPITRSILTHRTLKKLNNTYLAGLVPKIYDDGRIRGNFNQLGTATGRFSSSEPNLQNLPRDQTFYLWRASEQELEALRAEFPETLGRQERSKEPKHPAEGWEVFNPQKQSWESEGKIGELNGVSYGVEDNIVKEMWKCKTRNFVAAQPDHYLVEADYSQVELRIMAGESQEPTLLNAYATGLDVHTATAQMVFDVPDCGVPDCPEKDHPLCLVKKDQRQAGKTVNFSLLFGAGAETIGKQLGISKEEAQKLVDSYFEKLPSIDIWFEAVRRQAIKDRCVKTSFGRTRHFQYIHESDYGPNRQMVSKEKREAINFKIQGAAADVMKFAFVRAAARLRKYFGDQAKIVSTVHDSVLLEVHDSIDPADIARVLDDAMASPDMLRAVQGGANKWPALSIDLKVGKAWADAEDFTFPEDMTLPPVYEGELPLVRVRHVGIEHDEGETTNETSIFSAMGAVSNAPVYSDQPVSWIIEVHKLLSQPQIDSLRDFLRSRQDDDAKGSVTVYLPNAETGEMIQNKLPGTFRIAMQDEIDLRIKIGSCILRQELDDVDPDEVLRGIDFGI